MIIQEQMPYLEGRWNDDYQLHEGFDLRFYQYTPNFIDWILITQNGSGNKMTVTANYNLTEKQFGKWIHVTGTYNHRTGEQKIYGNGNYIKTRNHNINNTIVPLTYHPDMAIGYSRVNNGYFNGSIDEVMIFNRTLSEEEVKNIYFFNNIDIYLDNNISEIPLIGCNITYGDTYDVIIITDNQKTQTKVVAR